MTDWVTDIHMVFPDERSRTEFETSFRGWLTGWQTQQLILRRLAATTADEDETHEPASAGLAGPPAHKLGFDTSSPSGLIGTGDIVVTLPDGTEISIGGLYLNIIPGW
jgi:hypothetical protein